MTDYSNIDIQAFYSRLYSQNERVMKFGLSAISKALEREGNICNYPIIAVGGTNGKGQISAMLANAAHWNGYKTALFTSPHLVDFCERMRVSGHSISKEEVAQIGMQVLDEYGGSDSPNFCGIALTYFECCLIIALRWFHRQNVDFGIFEIGLGGRLDAVNALSPGLSVIASISLDHEEYLGHTADRIAREKAGIMRPGCPVIVGRQERDVLQDEANQHACCSFDALDSAFSCCGSQFICTAADLPILSDRQNASITLCGADRLPDCQRDNAAVAFMTLLRAKQIGLLDIDIEKTAQDLIPRTKWVGRMWPCTPKTADRYSVSQIILDGGHNPDGVRAFCAAVRTDRPHALLINSCRDKDIESMFPQYLSVFNPDTIYTIPVTSTPRACSPEEYCQRTGLPLSQSCDSIESALHRAANNVGPNGILYISGSLYLVGEAIQYFGEENTLDSIENTDIPSHF